MLACYSKDRTDSTPIYPIQIRELHDWLEAQTPRIQQWVKASGFSADNGSFCLLPSETGALEGILFGINSLDEFWIYGDLPCKLPEGHYRIERLSECAPWSKEQWSRILMAWGLGSYQFDLYRDTTLPGSSLWVPEALELEDLEILVSTIYLVRDLINTPTEAMGPAEVAEAVKHVAAEFNASVKVIEGDELLKENYPLIHAVGRASDKAPRLVDMRWGNPEHPKVVLIGKGVCYDTGGLSIKTTAGMLTMKKDMGGAAHALALARLVMAHELPVYLRVLIPAVENSISGNSFRPGDVFVARNGISVEVTNSDAEGRLILADALAEASGENPQIIIDFATLTGAARTALGPDLPALFSNSDRQAEALLKAGEAMRDPMWRLPLYRPYREMYLHSNIANIQNSSSKTFADAVLAALFLELFVGPDIEWAHLDDYSFNETSSPGRPHGGEAMALRACFYYLKEMFL